MADPGVRVECDGPVATVTLSRPHVLNAQTPAMWGELRTIGQDLPGDIRVDKDVPFNKIPTKGRA